MGQIYNVLLILAITFLMAAATVMLAYFADQIPFVIDDGVTIASKAHANIPAPAS